MVGLVVKEGKLGDKGYAACVYPIDTPSGRQYLATISEVSPGGIHGVPQVHKFCTSKTEAEDEAIKAWTELERRLN